MFSLAFIVSSLRVTEDNLVFDTVWSTLFLLNVFTAPKGTQWYIFISETKDDA